MDSQQNNIFSWKDNGFYRALCYIITHYKKKKIKYLSKKSKYIFFYSKRRDGKRNTFPINTG